MSHTIFSPTETIWDVAAVLEIVEDGTCVGEANCHGGSCGWNLDCTALEDSARILDFLDSRRPDPVRLRRYLLVLADHNLCQWHKKQRKDTLEKWCRKVRRYVNANELPDPIPSNAAPRPSASSTRPSTTQAHTAQNLEDLLARVSQMSIGSGVSRNTGIAVATPVAGSGSSVPSETEPGPVSYATAPSTLRNEADAGSNSGLRQNHRLDLSSSSQDGTGEGEIPTTTTHQVSRSASKKSYTVRNSHFCRAGAAKYRYF
ncbi:uncharacterized protein EI97DRAFT_438951 [Westerdykella ornata]|uniref:Uncharacterized protein n=1 Tax=Westerdykella ornata TaxID=318751 RepID=A0A6A6JVV1_WESOR|nr:uncharacterized protein EI97DRAFT_438951 [Westerdykella ornata]KAF2279846.1 hypothetical protein EI97DRAFT_438951 [Westerdykella ornata]